MDYEHGKLAGVKVRLGHQDFIIPPLNLEGLEAVEPSIEAVREGDLKPSERMTHIAKIVHAAIVRNYPDITVDALKKTIDLGNMSDVFNAAMSISGFKKADAGEAPATVSTGQPSTAA